MEAMEFIPDKLKVTWSRKKVHLKAELQGDHKLKQSLRQKRGWEVF